MTQTLRGNNWEFLSQSRHLDRIGRYSNHFKGLLLGSQFQCGENTVIGFGIDDWKSIKKLKASIWLKLLTHDVMLINEGHSNKLRVPIW